MIKAVCPKCRKVIKGKEEAEFLFNIGECVSCDHITGEQYEEQNYDSERNYQEEG